MHTRSMRIPWFVGAPGFLTVVVIAAFVANYLGADYFKRTRLEEANPFAVVAAATPSPAVTQTVAAAATVIPSTASTAPPSTATVSQTSPAAASTATAPPAPSVSTATATASVAATNSPPPGQPVVVSQGTFRDGEPGHRGSGTAKLGRDASGKPVLVFENFSVTNGPDLHVILGTSLSGGGQGLDLGKLKATDGTFIYPIPDGADLATFRSVTIWCASFPTIFAIAELEAR